MYFQELVNSVTTYVGNLIPVVENIISSVWSVITENIGKLPSLVSNGIQSVLNTILGALPHFLDSGFQEITSLE